MTEDNKIPFYFNNSALHIFTLTSFNSQSHKQKAVIKHQEPFIKGYNN